MDAIAAQLNEFGIFHQQSQANLDVRNNRQQVPPSNKVAIPPPSNANHQVVNPLDPIESSDSDSEPEETNDRGRNDGTLLASDPPKPL